MATFRNAGKGRRNIPTEIPVTVVVIEQPQTVIIEEKIEEPVIVEEVKAEELISEEIVEISHPVVKDKRKSKRNFNDSK